MAKLNKKTQIHLFTAAYPDLFLISSTLAFDEVAGHFVSAFTPTLVEVIFSRFHKLP
jgi:hypothetical protein